VALKRAPARLSVVHQANPPYIEVVYQTGEQGE